MDESTTKEVSRLLKRGLNHYGLGDVEAAISCWEKVIAKDPENRAARDYLETAYEERDADAAAAEKSAEPSATSPGVGEVDPFGDDDTPRTFDGPPTIHDPKSLPELPPPDPENPDARVAAGLRAYKAGDLRNAWDALQAAAKADPDRLDVQGYLAMVRSERARRWVKEIGDQGRALRLQRPIEEILTLNLRPDEGFVLSQIDGNVSIEQLLSLAGADRVRTLEILAKLLRAQLVC